jgi:predicted nucleic acid-binding protein
MTLIDTNVLLDILANDPLWSEWSGQQLAQRAALGPLVINDVIYAEVSVRMESQAELERAVARLEVRLDHMPVRALFLAGKSYRHYRSSGGIRSGALPDFFIGAHAQILGCPILTRDVRRYRTYFPNVVLITPER